MKKYSLLIQYSEVDKCYLATCPEFTDIMNLGGPIAHGDSWVSAANEAAWAIDSIMEVRKEDGHPPPDPQLFESKR
jgi:predicted RNase H-like HicB family nuclease